MIPTREQILDIVRGLESGDADPPEPAWMVGMSEEESKKLGLNLFRLAILGLLVHPETSASTQADLDLEEGKLENARVIFTEIRMQALELEK